MSTYRTLSRRRRIIVLLILVGFAFICICLLTIKSSIKELQCSDLKSMQFLEELCMNFSQGMVSGSLCSPLCVQKEIHFSGCLGHGVKSHVLGASWRNSKVILKAAKTHHDLSIEHIISSLDLRIQNSKSLESFSIATDTFLKQVCNTLYLDHAKVSMETVARMVKDVIAECDVRQDGVLNVDEIVACVRLLETKEFSFNQLLKGNSAFPRVLGVCGSIYAVEYSPSEPFLGFLTAWSEVRDWKFRAQLAIALLEMVESLEDTEFGTIYLCDLQESNFGVVRRKDGSLVAKAIDMDISFFERTLLDVAVSEQNNSCSSDRDCEFVGCLIKCDMRTKGCSGVLSSNNLRGICMHLFKQLHQHHPALLLNPPRTIADQLEELLNQCVLSETPHTDINLLKQLQALLISSF